MTKEHPRKGYERTLGAAEGRLAENNKDTQLLFERAHLLASLGRIEEAKQAYLNVLAFDPRHPDALNDLGALLYETGYRSAAKTVYMQAISAHPESAAAHVNLANLLFDESDIEGARRHYEEALRYEPDLAEAHQGLTRIFSGMRDDGGVRRHREKGFRNHAMKTLPYYGAGKPIDLLLLVAAEGGNIPLRHHISNQTCRTTAVYPEFFDLGKPLPEYDIVFNSIGDADFCRPALEAAQKLLTKTAAPVINPPEKILHTGRLEIAERLTDVPYVKTAKIQLMKKADLARKKFDYPLLLRAPGFHTGQHFAKVDTAENLVRMAEGLPGEDVFAIEYLDAQGKDGLFRKYRVMMIGGRLYPLHMAVSNHWKVHYFSAAESAMPQYQQEEKKFLEDMPSVLGAKGLAALEKIAQRLGLDYGGIDFGLDHEGNILVFEANATMIIPQLRQEQNAVRKAAVEKASEAVKNLLNNLICNAEKKKP